MKKDTETMRKTIDRAMRCKPRPSLQSRMETGLKWTLAATVGLALALLGFVAAAMVAAAM
jgi:hypothetical protein